MTERSAMDKMNAKFEADGRLPIDIPEVGSFRQFMDEHARVLITNEKGQREFVPYTTKGREPLDFVIDLIDLILGSFTGKMLTDALLAVCGGAQFGKTILGLHLKEYIAAVKMMHSYYVLPDKDLVNGIIDQKERPEILDQIPWLNDMVSIGKAIHESGKTVNRKGAMLFTNGKVSAFSYMTGMNKIPTSISADCVIQDESDDIDPENQKFLPGRMSASPLRFFMAIGTMRFHGAGQNKLFEDGSQHIGTLTCPDCGERINPEESWPQICRVAMDGAPASTDPQLTLEGDFKIAGADETAASFEHEAHYYFACTKCGTELDRTAIDYEAQRPDRVKLRKWSVRVSQMCCSGLPVKMFVADWCENAVRDPDAMRAFSCDRLAIPKSTLQSLTPQILHRARSLEDFDLSMTGHSGTLRFGGLDTGDRCFFSGSEVESPLVKRLLWAESISTERVRSRMPILFDTLKLSCLFIDIGAERNLARDLAFMLNPALMDFDGTRVDDADNLYINFGHGLVWDGPKKTWRGLRCALVEFSLNPDQGIRHKLGVTQEEKFYPIIQCNRDETIQRVINQLLTAEEGVVEVIDGKMRTEPVFRLPSRKPGAQAVVETFDKHLLAGSRKDKDAKGREHFVDKLENHYLLAAAYAGLAENVAGIAGTVAPFAYRVIKKRTPLEGFTMSSREHRAANHGKVLM